MSCAAPPCPARLLRAPETSLCQINACCRNVHLGRSCRFKWSNIALPLWHIRCRAEQGRPCHYFGTLMPFRVGASIPLLWDRSTSRRRLLVYLPQELDPIVGCANYCREPRSPSCAIETHIKSGVSFQGSRLHRVRLPTSLDRLADDCRKLTFNVGRVDGGHLEIPITRRQIRNLRISCTGGGDGNLVVEGRAACSVADYIAR
jgi:hypothetical protein